MRELSASAVLVARARLLPWSLFGITTRGEATQAYEHQLPCHPHP